jgi:hypothetical protein
VSYVQTASRQLHSAIGCELTVLAGLRAMLLSPFIYTTLAIFGSHHQSHIYCVQAFRVDVEEERQGMTSTSLIKHRNPAISTASTSLEHNIKKLT